MKILLICIYHLFWSLVVKATMLNTKRSMSYFKCNLYDAVLLIALRLLGRNSTFTYF